MSKPHVHNGKRYTGWELIELHRKRAERKKYLLACATAILELTK